MGKAAKRFIKKVPPSGGSPVFKLTLPHSIVHTHLQHLIDADFEIASSATAVQCWQGSIAPRRNKDRSEYTLQGWKLFAEAHRVKAGDQVSFELVSPKRLLVQVISAADGRAIVGGDSPSKSPKHRANSSPSRGKLHSSVEKDLLECQVWPSNLDEEAWRSFPEAPTQQLSAVSEEGSSQMDADRQMELAGQTFAAKVGSTPSLEDWQTDSAMTPHGQPLSSMQMMSAGNLQSASGSPASIQTLFKQIADSTMDMTGDCGPAAADPIDDFFADKEIVSRAADPGASNMHLSLQLHTLTSTIQSLQADVKRFEQRALKAESEAANLKLAFGELRLTLDRQSRAAFQAGAGLERAASRLTSPNLLACVDQNFAEKMLKIQEDMFSFVDMLKSSVWGLAGTDF